MYDPGLDLREWEALEDDVRADPAHALPEIDRLVARMLGESGYEPAHEIVEAAERDSDEVSPGDFAAAISGYRSVFDHLVATRAAAGGELDAADAEDA